MGTIILCEQRSEEWYRARAGAVTASVVSDVMSKPRDKSAAESKGRRNLKARIVAEILSGKPVEDDGFENYAMRRGTELEPVARGVFEARTGIEVDQVGCVLHGTIPRYLSSPDGIGKDFGLELKCVCPAVQIDNFLSGKAPSEYHLQMLSGMDCTDFDYWWFASYCAAFAPPHDLFVVRFPRDEKRIEEIRAAVVLFNSEVLEVVEKLKRMQ